jgi:plastocyanin
VRALAAAFIFLYRVFLMFDIVVSGRRVFAVVVGAALLAGCSSEPADEIPAAAPVVTTAAPVTDATTSTVTGRAPAAKGGLPAVVILKPVVDREFPPSAYAGVMDQISLTFIPPVLFVRTGEPTEFRNSDEVLHNVRVYEDETKEPAFNVAIPTGGTFSYTMKRDGFYNVGCDIHPGMAAVVVATATPYTALAAPDGGFAIEGVQPGAYQLTVYADVQKLERDVTVANGRTDLGIITGQ